ncbi:MAG: SCP2 sterol-binding domain-containing protein [Chromatiales bacterium]|nr:SCP2 sterol-binding domain-containing protein [Chromatiales bacterium]
MKAPIKPLTILLRSLPDSVHSELLSRLFNHLLRGQYMADQLYDLDGKRLAIRITDTRTELLFRIQGNQLRRQPRRLHPAWDVRISGTLADFWLLASRSEDPDTLFFNRTLAIEGETEAGLYLKNLLDALDFDLQLHLDSVLGRRLGGNVGHLLQRSGFVHRPGF